VGFVMRGLMHAQRCDCWWRWTNQPRQIHDGKMAATGETA
jgi:hypothetical protein